MNIPINPDSSIWEIIGVTFGILLCLGVVTYFTIKAHTKINEGRPNDTP